MPKVLEIFDFDGTLFRNPLDTPENRRKYEKATGIPWLIDKQKSKELSRKHGRYIGMRRGWYGRKESLEPPLVPDPAPKEMFLQKPCEEFLASKADENTITIMMTGRHAGIINQVLRIARDGGLLKVSGQKDHLEVADKFVTCYFMGQNGPAPKGKKPGNTLDWKIWTLEQLLEVHPEVEKVVFWEDREEHVKEFRELDEILDETVIVNHVIDEEK